MATFTARDRETSRAIHKFFRQAWWQDRPDFIIWCFTRPPALLIYNVLIPFATAYALQAIITKQFSQVGHYAWGVFWLAIAYCVLWGVGGLAIIRNARIGQIFIVRTIFANYLEKDYEFFNNSYLGALGAQASRLRENHDEYDQIIFNGLTKEAIIIVASVAIIAYHSMFLALVTIGLLLLFLGFTVFMTRWRLKFRRTLSEAASDTAGVIGDALGHGTTVKSFAAEGYEKKRLNRSLIPLVNAQYNSWFTSIPMDLGRMFLAAVATFLLLILTGHLYEQHKITIALVILIQLYVIKLIMATQDIADLLKSYEAVMSSAHQAVKTMLIKPSVSDKAEAQKMPKNSEYEIELRDVEFHYPDAPEKVKAVKNFDLVIKTGEKVGLVGYSGSGKTTITKLLLRFMDVTGGEILVDGIDIRNLAQKDLRSQIAYVPQEPLLFHRSIFENIAYGRPKAKKSEIEAAGKAAYVDEFVSELKNGYDTWVGEKGVKLSGGQRQRVAIARALLKNAPILVLDEATSSLDSRSEQFIQKALWKLMEGRTAIVIAHRLSTIQRMDRIVVMDKGKIVEVGTHEQLLKNKRGIYVRLWAHQSGGYLVTAEN